MRVLGDGHVSVAGAHVSDDIFQSSDWCVGLAFHGHALVLTAYEVMVTLSNRYRPRSGHVPGSARQHISHRVVYIAYPGK